jgi:hypothetical protein
LRPRARAATSPARVRSTISSRSNSASAAKIPKMSLPAAVVVSICAPYPVSTRKPNPAGGQIMHGGDEMMQIVAQTVELPHQQGVTGAQRLQAAGQTGPVVPLARREVLVQVLGCDAGGKQRVALQVEDLGAVGAETRI